MIKQSALRPTTRRGWDKAVKKICSSKMNGVLWSCFHMQAWRWSSHGSKWVSLCFSMKLWRRWWCGDLRQKHGHRSPGKVCNSNQWQDFPSAHLSPLIAALYLMPFLLSYFPLELCTRFICHFTVVSMKSAQIADISQKPNCVIELNGANKPCPSSHVVASALFSADMVYLSWIVHNTKKESRPHCRASLQLIMAR